MASDNFAACAAFTLKYEGGYVDHPKDPGGATNLGITIGTLRAWRGTPITKADVRALTHVEAMQIYRKNYWNAVGGDALPRGVDLAVWDYGVNSGPARGRAAYAKARVAGAPAEIVKRVCALRRSFVQGLRTWSTFGRGWSARIAACEALGVKMALLAAGLSNATVSGSLHTDAAAAKTKAATKTKQAKGATTGAGVPSVAAASPDWELWIFAGVVFVVLAGVAFMLWKAAQDEDARAVAFKTEAERL